tara:strand:+ start:232 stop:375 length:144 start_codon:yes stop_codon:yes gene_type:complete
MGIEEKWMLITYYCPTHGDSDVLKQIEVKKKLVKHSWKKAEFIKFNY